MNVVDIKNDKDIADDDMVVNIYTVQWRKQNATRKNVFMSDRSMVP